MATFIAEDRVAEIWDKAHAQGHRCGYMDAVAGVWEFSKDIPSTDPRFAVLVDLVEVLRERRDKALDH